MVKEMGLVLLNEVVFRLRVLSKRLLFLFLKVFIGINLFKICLFCEI